MSLIDKKYDVDVDALEAWDITAGDPNLVVGIIDTGVLMTHPDLSNQIWTNPKEIPNNNIDDDHNGFIDDVHGWDFINNDNDPTDDNLHGSHCSGIVAAERNNNRGIAGIAPNVKILPLKILDGDGVGDTHGLLYAISYATMLKKQGVNIRVLNASLGGGDPTSAVEEALMKANKNKILFVAAAGNDGTDNDEAPIYPASYGTKLPNVISVASVDIFGKRSSFSNFGPHSVHIAAPGSFVWSTITNNFYLPSSGTSMAAPHVTGVAALVSSRFPNLSPKQVRDRILNSVKPIEDFQGKLIAPGVVSAELALK